VAAKVTFDGPNLLVIAKPGVVALDVQKDIYSDWKAETISGAGDDLSKFPPVFVESFGGNDLGGGSNAGGFYIFNNAAGWRLRPDEADHDLVITGNVYPVNSALPIIVPTLGGFTVLVSFDRSSLSLGVIQISADLDKVAKNVAALMGGL
jgi:hypothetical protein